MIQIPQLEPTTAKPARAAEPPAQADGDAFSRILHAQDRPQADEPASEAADDRDELPPELLAEARQQLEDGVPLAQVLAELRERLQTFAAVASAPGAEVEPPGAGAVLSDQALLARLGLRPGNNVQDKAASPDLAAALEPEAELEADLDLAGQELRLPRDALPGKERLALLGRLQVAEPAARTTDLAGNLAQSPPLKGLELPAMLKDVALNSAGQAKPAGEPLTLPVRVGEPGWGQALAQRVMWMAGRDQQTAEIKLNPAHLGPLEVKLSLKHDQASVTLLAANGAVKEALEQALPRLRDMFSQQDIQLVQADVGQRQDPRHAGAGEQLPDQQGTGGEGRHQGTGAPLEEQNDAAEGVMQQGLGLLDAYA